MCSSFHPIRVAPCTCTSEFRLRISYATRLHILWIRYITASKGLPIPPAKKKEGIMPLLGVYIVCVEQITAGKKERKRSAFVLLSIRRLGNDVYAANTSNAIKGWQVWIEFTVYYSWQFSTKLTIVCQCCTHARLLLLSLYGRMSLPWICQYRITLLSDCVSILRI
jgi:hypothetical protein